MANAEQFVATSINSSWQPSIGGEVIGNQLPTWDATEVGATTEQKEEVLVWL